jgi:hypothetical protein
MAQVRLRVRRQNDAQQGLKLVTLADIPTHGDPTGHDDGVARAVYELVVAQIQAGVIQFLGCMGVVVSSAYYSEGHHSREWSQCESTTIDNTTT